MQDNNGTESKEKKDYIMDINPTLSAAESAYKELEEAAIKQGHVIESSEPQENLTEALATFSKKFREYQQGIDPEISKAIQKGLWDLIGTPVSAPSESQEEIVKHIASIAWKGAANAYRMYPDNKHTFASYWDAAKDQFKEFFTRNP